MKYPSIKVLLMILATLVVVIILELKFLKHKPDPFPCKETWEKVEYLKRTADKEKDPFKQMRLETSMSEELQKYCRFCNCEE